VGMCATANLESLTEEKPFMQTAHLDKLYLEVHAQHVEAPFIVAIQYKALQCVCMQ